MPRLDTPLLLSPVFKSKIWGRLDLAPLFDRAQLTLPRDVPIGEAWLTDDDSIFLNGLPAGMSLRQAVGQFGPELCGRAWQEPRFPILAKYLFTNDWLSVQVHPDDAYARVHDPGSPGKWEMWYVVQCGRAAKLLLGTRPKVTREQLRAAFERAVSTSLLGVFRPRPGEAFLVPPGAVHALGPKLIIFEAEQYSDLTYRLDDFGRAGLDGKPRPLHLEKGMEVVRLDLQFQGGLPRLQITEPYGVRRFVAACRHFAVEEVLMRRRATFGGSSERVEILSVMEGEGRIETPAGWLGYRTGETWLVPPATGAYRFVPDETTRLLKTYVPDLEKDFRRPLAKRGKKSGQIARVIAE